MESAGVPRYVMVDQGIHHGVSDAARGRLGGRAWEATVAEGRAMSFEEAVSYVFEEGPAPA